MSNYSANTNTFNADFRKNCIQFTRNQLIDLINIFLSQNRWNYFTSAQIARRLNANPDFVKKVLINDFSEDKNIVTFNKKFKAKNESEERFHVVYQYSPERVFINNYPDKSEYLIKLCISHYIKKDKGVCRKEIIEKMRQVFLYIDEKKVTSALQKLIEENKVMFCKGTKNTKHYQLPE